MSLDGKTAVVTGGTKGVGQGVARELAQHGARVFVTGRSAPDHERITGLRCDHRIDAQVNAAFQRILCEAYTIDILVNNVWGGYEGMTEDGNSPGPNRFGNNRSGAGTRCSMRAFARTIWQLSLLRPR